MRRFRLFLAAWLLAGPGLALAQPAQPVQGVGTASTAAGGVLSVDCVTGCSGGGGGGNVVVTGPLGAQTAAASVATTVNGALPVGTNILGKVGIDQTTPGTTNGVQVNAALPAGTNTIGNVGTLPLTTGGLSIKSFIVANNTTSVAVDASAGQIYGISAYSISAATPVYLKFYNAAQGSTTCGSGTPVERELVPATGATGSGIILPIVAGAAYSTAITVCVTAGIADNDTTAPAASSYIVNVLFK